jgi:hypothetical protein
MRKSIINLLGGAFFGLLTLTFTACGNIDNPLEIISNTNSTTAFALKNILENNSKFVVKFTLLETECTVTIVNDGDNGFVIESSEGLDPNLFSFRLTEDEKQVVLTCHNSVGGDMGDPISQIIFNLQDESFYIINALGYDMTFDGKASVNGDSGTLTNSCPDKATIEISISGTVMGTRTGVFIGGDLFIYYNKEKGEKWKDVVDRYATSDFDGLFSVDGDNNNVALKYGYDTGDVMYDNETKVLVTDVVGKKAGAAYDSNYKATLSAIGPS